MQEFIRTRGVTPCPPRHASGIGLHKATAYGVAKEETERLAGKPSVRCYEENLAKAKILTMLKDLAGRIEGSGITTNKAQNHERIRAEAYRWFFHPKSDFEDWCDTAGFDADYVRDKALAVHENGLPEWRAAPGTGKRFAERKAYRERIRK